MIASYLSLIRANLRASWYKYTLTGVGIALSAFFLSAVLLLNAVVSATYTAQYSARFHQSDVLVVANGSNQRVSSQIGDFTPQDLEYIRRSPQVAGFWENAVLLASYQKSPGDSVPYVLSQAPSTPEMFPYQVHGRLPENDREVILPEYLAENLQIKVGDRFRGLDPIASMNLPTTASLGNFEGGALSLDESLPTKDYTVTGTFSPSYMRSADSTTVYAGGDMIAQLSEITQREHKNSISLDISTVAVKLHEGISAEDFERELTAHHNSHLSVLSAQEYGADIHPQDRIGYDLLNVILLALAGLALMVSAFVITNTLNVLLSQRTREFALLRTLGASRHGLLTMVLAESTVLGVFAASVGIAAAYLLFAVLTWRTQALVFNFSLLPVWVSLPICLAVVWISALKPAYLAAKAPPVQGLREGTARQISTHSRRQGIIAASLLVGSVIVYIIAEAQALEHAQTNETVEHGVQVFVLNTVAGALLGFALLAAAYLLLKPLVKFWASLVARTLLGSIACQNTLRSPARLVATGRALMVGMMLVAMVLTGHATLDASMMKFLNQESRPSAVLEFNGAKDSDSNAAEHQGQPPVSDAERYLHQAQDARHKVHELSSVRSTALVQYVGNITSDGDSELQASEAPAVYALSDQDIASALPSDSPTILQGHVVVLPRAAQQASQGREPPRYTLRGPRGEVHLKAVYSQLETHNIYVSRDTAALVQDLDHPQVPEGFFGGDSYLIVHAHQPLNATESTELHRDLIEISSTTHGLYLAGSLEAHATIGTVLVVTLYAILAVLALVVLIAVLGMANTLLLSSHERARENALLRALGLSRKQLRSVIMIEAILVTLSALLIALVGGTLAGFVVVHGLVSQSFETVYRVPWVEYSFSFLGALLIAIAASWFPAVRSSKVSPVQALRHE